MARAPAAATPGRGVKRTAAQRSLRDLRRGQIVAVARALVAEGGPEGLTIGALEERLDFTRGVITYHFADRDEIVDAVLASAAAEIDAATRSGVRGSATVDERVRAVLESNVRGYLEHREAGQILLSFWGRPAGAGRRARAASIIFAGYRAQSAELVRAARKANPRCTARPRPLGAVLVGVVIGLVVQAYLDPAALDTDAALEEAAACVSARLR